MRLSHILLWMLWRVHENIQRCTEDLQKNEQNTGCQLGGGRSADHLSPIGSAMMLIAQ